MTKGRRQRKYSAELKRETVETMRTEGLGHREAAKRFGVRDHKTVALWERIYLEEGATGLQVERRGRATGVGKGPSKQVEEDLISENQRLRAEVDYLKKLNALVSERVRREKRLK